MAKSVGNGHAQLGGNQVDDNKAGGVSAHNQQRGWLYNHRNNRVEVDRNNKRELGLGLTIKLYGRNKIRRQYER